MSDQTFQGEKPTNDRTIYVLDGYGLIFRSYFAFVRTPIRNTKGENASAIFGFFRVLASFIKQYKPQYLAVALDSRTPTFRDELYPAYKATRDNTPDDLKAQFPIIETVMGALGLPMLRVDGFEADDVMATLARQCKDLGHCCVIVSADKDMLQLVNPLTRILRPAREGGFEEMDRQAVYENKGVWPEQVLDYLSLLGDASDNVPGVKGIGEKTASKLLSDFGDLDGIYARLDTISSSSQKEKLLQGKADAYFSRKLITLREDVPVPLRDDDPWEGLHVHGFNGPAAAALLKDMGINQLAAEIARLGGPSAGGAEEAGIGIVAEAPATGLAGAPVSPQSAPQVAEPKDPATAPAGTGDQKVTLTGRAATAALSGPASYDPAVHSYELVTTIDGVSKWADKIREAGTYVMDTETDGLDPHSSRLVGISLSVAEGEACYIALWGPGPMVNGHRTGPVPILEDKDVRAILKPVFEDPSLKLVGQNIKFDFLMLRAWGVRPANVYFDTMIAAWLVDTTANLYGMDELARVYLGYRTIHFDELFQDLGFLGEEERARYAALDAARVADLRLQAGMNGVAASGDTAGGAVASKALASAELDFGDEPSEADPAGAGAGGVKRGKLKPEDMRFSRVPLERAAVYSAEDCDVTLRLWKVLDTELRRIKVDGIFFDLEMPLIPVLADMEWRGMVLKADYLAAYSLELGRRMAATEAGIYELVGHPFNIGSTKQLQEVLFVERKLQGTKKTKTGYSTDTSVLEELASEDPVPQKILEYRGLTKLKSTYVDTLPLLINPVTGRVHTTFVQTGTATGRIASKDPNLQNIPIKDEDGRRIREAFVPAPGHVFVSADYSQIELVVLAHFAQDPGLTDAFAKGVDVHRATGALIFGVAPEDVSPEQRRIAKTINFGVMYGMGAFRLGKELGIPQKQAQAFIDAYFATYNGIGRFIEETVRTAESEGGVRTMMGRFRPLQQINSKNRVEKQAAERVAVNTPIQGSAADIVKRAMLCLDKRLKEEGLDSCLVLQVHDELILEVPEHEREKVMAVVAEEMNNAVRMSVPLRSNVEWGLSWGAMH